MKRFWSKVNKTKKCWIWTSATHKGYGLFHTSEGTRRSHRVSYELLKGRIPKSQVLDHLCKNTLCVNPKHLELVTQQINVLRGEGIPAINARKTHCNYGHKFTKENTYFKKRPDGVHRECRECNKRRCKERYHSLPRTT